MDVTQSEGEDSGDVPTKDLFDKLSLVSSGQPVAIVGAASLGLAVMVAHQSAIDIDTFIDLVRLQWAHMAGAAKRK